MADDFSTYEGRQAYRDAHPGAIVDASGAYYPSSGQTVSGSSSVPAPSAPAMPSGADAYSRAINQAVAALNSSDLKAFNEQVREWDKTFGFNVDQWNEGIRQYNQNLGIAQAGLTGTYQGAPTLGGLNQYANFLGTYGPGGAQTLQAQNQAFNQQIAAINAAAAAQTNPFRQAEITGQLGRLLSGSGVAGFQAPGGTSQTDFSGMGNLQRMIDDIRGGPGAINSQTVQQSLNMIPTPNKLNSQDFFRSDPNTQNLLLTGMQQKYGIDPATSLQQIRNTLPSFTAPSTFGRVAG